MQMVVGLFVSASATIIGVISFWWEGIDVDTMMFGIWPLGAILLGVSIVSFVFFLFLAEPAYSTIRSSIRKRQLEKSHAVLELVWKYRKALDQSSSFRGLSQVDIYDERLKKLKIMREDAVKSIRDLDEHIETLAPYLEEWPLNRVQREVAKWYSRKDDDKND